MKLDVFILDEETQRRISDVIIYATLNPLSFEDVKRCASGDTGAVGDDKNFVVDIPMNTRCVYSHEYQECGLCRHLSVSLKGKDHKAMVNPAVLEVLMDRFKFRGGLNQVDAIWVEEIQYENDESRHAINVLQQVSPERVEERKQNEEGRNAEDV